MEQEKILIKTKFTCSPVAKDIKDTDIKAGPAPSKYT